MHGGRQMRRLGLIAAVVLGGTLAAQAAGNPVIKVTDEMPDAVLRAELEQVGYDGAENIVRHGDMIRATARRDGKPVEILINARTGEVEQEAATRIAIGTPRPGMSPAELRTQLQPLGYDDVRNVSEVDNVYSLLAHRDGKWDALQIDATTGEVRVVR